MIYQQSSQFSMMDLGQQNELNQSVTDIQYCDYSYDAYNEIYPTNEIQNDPIPSDLEDLNSLMNCDITSLDAYIHNDNTSEFKLIENVSSDVSLPSKSPSNLSSCKTFSSSSSSSPSTSEDDVFCEFFPELSSSIDKSEYRLKRDKNNKSSQKSRAKRKATIQAMKNEKELLEKKKIKLTAAKLVLKSQVDEYKKMIMELTHS